MKGESIMRDIVPFRHGQSVWDPSDWVRDFFSRDLLDDFFGSSLLTHGGTGAIRTDVKETDKEYIVEAELPGFDKKDIELDLTDDRLTITARHEESKDDENQNYIRRERRYGEVCRSFLVRGIDAEKAKADYKNGILRITLPKQEEVVKRNRININ
jgi:HSP20 family protein